MCGRYALYGPKSRSRPETECFSNLDQFPGSWNVAPTHMMPITRLHDGAVEQINARWGLIPQWAKDEKIGFKCINARAETVATSCAGQIDRRYVLQRSHARQRKRLIY
jgi:putative SOS response-associated peptidase YedK